MPTIVNEGRRVINNVKHSSSLYIMKTLLTLLLALVCIVDGSEYFFTTNNMLLFEFFISAIPSFVLSLQPNTERVKGKFIPYVLSRALPGALTMAIAVLVLYVFQNSRWALDMGLVIKTAEGGHQLTSECRALMVVALTLSGLVMLHRICKPFNLLRAVLFTVTTGFCTLAFCVDGLGNIVFDGWSNLDFTLPQVLLMVIIIQACFPVSGLLIRGFDMLTPVDETDIK